MNIDDIRSKFPQYGDLSDQQLLDGVHKKFYSDMPRDEFDQKLGIKPEGYKPSGASGVTDILRRAGQMIPFADEIKAGAYALPALATDENFSDRYNAYKQFDASEQQRISQEMPAYQRVLADTAGLGASMLGGGALLKGAGLARPVASTGEAIGQAAAAGGLYGGVAGASEGEGAEERLRNAGVGALVGGGLGAGAQLAAGGVGKMLANRQALRQAPALEALKQKESALFRAADQQGIVIRQPAVQRVANDIKAKMTDFGVRERMEPKSVSFIKELLDDAGDNVTLKHVHGWRRELNKIIGSNSAEKSDRAAARMMREVIDDTLLKPGWLQESDVIGKNAANATSLLRQGIETSRARFKADKIAEIMRTAESNTGQFSVAGRENAIRTEFRKLGRRLAKNPAGWTKDEIKAINDVGNGTNLRNVIRWLGKFAPTSPLYSILGGGAAFQVGGPLATGALLAGGTGAKLASRAMTESAANQAGQLVRGGGRLPRPPQLMQSRPTDLGMGVGALVNQ